MIHTREGAVVGAAAGSGVAAAGSECLGAGAGAGWGGEGVTQALPAAGGDTGVRPGVV